MTRPDRGPTPTFVLISRVWAVAGALALVVALVTRSLVVAVFGGLALLAAAVVFGLQAAQDRSVERNSRVAGGPVPPTLASDILGRPRRGTSDGRPEESPRPDPDLGPEPPDPAPADVSADGDDTGGDEPTTYVDPGSTRRTGPRRRPEPDVPRTARNRGRRNPTVGRDTGPLPTQQAGEGGDGDVAGAEGAEGAEGDAEDEVVDEPGERREPEESEIDDAETVDDDTPDGSRQR